MRLRSVGPIIPKFFEKDWEQLSRSGRYDMPKLKTVMLLLIANDAPLGPEWKDHALKGEWAAHRECHVGGDFLLVYYVDDSAGPSGSVVFVRAGTHSELFKCPRRFRIFALCTLGKLLTPHSLQNREAFAHQASETACAYGRCSR